MCCVYGVETADRAVRIGVANCYQCTRDPSVLCVSSNALGVVWIYELPRHSKTTRLHSFDVLDVLTVLNPTPVISLPLPLRSPCPPNSRVSLRSSTHACLKSEKRARAEESEVLRQEVGTLQGQLNGLTQVCADARVDLLCLLFFLRLRVCGKLVDGM